MINWNIVPMTWSSPNFPYILFTEMEWIGKLAYIVESHDDRITNLESTIADHENRINNIETVEIPAIKVRLDNAELTLSNHGDRISTNENAINTINTVTIPAIENRVESLENETKILLHIPTIPYPVDDNNIRSYTIDIPEGYTVLDVSFNLVGDYTEEFGITSKTTHIANLATHNGSANLTYVTNTEITGEYGTMEYLANNINISTDNNNHITISYGREFLSADMHSTVTNFYGLPNMTRCIFKLYKLPTV